MTCKDCIHYDVCYWFKNYGADEYCVDCRKFKDKSRIVELPCNVGQQVWFIADRKVYEGTVSVIRPFIYEDRIGWHGNVKYELEDPFYRNGRTMKHEVSVVFYVFGNNTVAYFTREEAEEALRKEWEK